MKSFTQLNQAPLRALALTLFAFALFSSLVHAADTNATATSGAKVVVVDAGVPTAIGIALVIFALIILYLFRNVIVNTILGFIALAILSLIGITIPINLISILVIAIFGLAGLGVLVLLTIFKLI